MKLVVNIDDETYNDIKKGKIYSSFRDVLLKSVNVIANGTPLEQEPCDDCVSRQAVLDMMQIRMGAKELYKAVYDLPPVTPQSKTGWWARELIRNEYGGCIGAKMICSECGQDNGYDKRMKFCPNCGAKMEVEK